MKIDLVDCNPVIDRRVDVAALSIVKLVSDAIAELLKGPLKLSTKAQEAARQRWLLYLGVMIRDSIDAAACLYLHGIGRPALAHNRQIFECTVKSMYFEVDPEEALFQQDLLSRDQLDMLESLGEKDVQAAKRFYASEALRNPEIARDRKPKKRRSKRVAEMLRKVDTRSEHSYAYFYRQSSKHLHQSPLGMAEVLGLQSSAPAETKAGYAVETPNLLLLETAQLAVVYIRVFERSTLTKGRISVEELDSKVESLIKTMRTVELPGED